MPMVFAVFGAMAMLLVISLMHMHRASAQLASQHGQFQMLYNQWGTNDNNDHWGGVGRCASSDLSAETCNYMLSIRPPP